MSTDSRCRSIAASTVMCERPQGSVDITICRTKHCSGPALAMLASAAECNRYTVSRNERT